MKPMWKLQMAIDDKNILRSQNATSKGGKKNTPEF